MTRLLPLSRGFVRGAGLAAASLAVVLSGCVKRSATVNVAATQKQEDPAVVVHGSDAIKPYDPKVGGYPVGADSFIPVYNAAGTLVVPVNFLLSDTSLAKLQLQARTRGLEGADLSAYLEDQMRQEFEKFSKAGISLTSLDFRAEVGFAEAYMPKALFDELNGGAVRAGGRLAKALPGLNIRLQLEPTVLTKFGQNERQSVSDEIGSKLDGRVSHEDFSGLKRMGVTNEYVAQISQEVGEAVDGSAVKVGVTDTGVTLNHPAFTDASGKSRVAYMKDYTNEGTLYFNPAAKLTVTAATKDDKLPVGFSVDNTVFIQGQILTQGGAFKVPVADAFQDLPKTPISVSPELKELLLKKDSGVMLGFTAEQYYENKDQAEEADINGNGTATDKFLAFYDPAAKKIWFDLTATGDFSKAKPVGNFNSTKESLVAGHEQIGFDIRATKATNSDGKPAVILQASVVGYDPGNHGSHVSGIIAARKTLSNDVDDTLARGVVPNAPLFVNRVCSNTSGCSATSAFIDLALTPGVDVVNMSLGGLSPLNDGYGSQEAMINRLTNMKNVLFVISAGNSGPGHQTIGSPSTARLSLSVGASASRQMIERQYQWPGKGSSTDSKNAASDDFMLFFSSRGPTAAGGFKPNVSAPGTELSSVQLNSLGQPALDVYWGTSMAAPTATGAAAFLLDAARKYNKNHPNDPQIPTDVLSLRNALISSAKPFDVNSFTRKDGSVGTYTNGQYTWIDQGTGLVHVPSAWEALKAQAKTLSVFPSAVTLGGKSVALDYIVRTNTVNPYGVPYDCALTPGSADPRCGSGLYLTEDQTQEKYDVFIQRAIPEQFATLAGASGIAALENMLNSSADDFVLETTVYGSKVEWLKIGTLEDASRYGEGSDSLTIIGRGNSTLDTTVGKHSQLHINVDRELMATLPAGDHGAVINAFRVKRDSKGKVIAKDSHASFSVPVYFIKAHQRLAEGNGFALKGHAKSFSVDRNYVNVPAGVNYVSIEWSVDAPKTDKTGRVTNCAGVELMALTGLNTQKPIAARKDARVANCDGNGNALPANASKKIELNSAQFTPGLWDVHMFGSYNFASSPYKLSVNYATLKTTNAKGETIKSIVGDKAALEKGAFNLVVADTSIAGLAPDSTASTYSLTGVTYIGENSVATDETLAVKLPGDTDGKLRSYDADVKSVTFAIDGSADADLDLTVMECSSETDGKSCVKLAASAGATASETVTFSPKAGKFYRFDVAWYSGSDTEKFQVLETKVLGEEKGAVAISGSNNTFTVDYSIDLSDSAILKRDEITKLGYAASGTVKLKTKAGGQLAVLPVVGLIK